MIGKFTVINNTTGWEAKCICLTTAIGYVRAILKEAMGDRKNQESKRFIIKVEVEAKEE